MLETQANQIESVLAHHCIAAYVAGGVVAPRFIQFQIGANMGTRVNKVLRWRRKLLWRWAVAPWVSIASRTICLWKCQTKTTHPCGYCRSARGLEESNAPLLLRLIAADACHVLVAGTTGSGKTAMARRMLAWLALHNPPDLLRLILIDPKGAGLHPGAACWMRRGSYLER